MPVKWRRTTALLAAALILGAAGLLIRQGQAEVTPMSLRRPLSSLDRNLAGFRAVGRDRVLDSESLNILKPQAYLIRNYRDAQGFGISLFVAFFGQQREGQMIHSPRNCLPGAGWQITMRREIEIPGPQGPVSVNHFLLTHQTEKVSVLYWYQGRGRVEPNEYKDRLRLFLDGIMLGRTDGALVRLTSVKNSHGPDALSRQVAMAQALIPAMEKILPSSGPAGQAP
ncbi:MAG: EpsI family protein [Desulfarculaceae bacterium]|jgi:EpsI family protein